jgi:hypothetical protein
VSDQSYAAANEVLRREQECRRCHICQCSHPPFGFGPPLTREMIWACRVHRAEVEAMLQQRSNGGSGSK